MIRTLNAICVLGLLTACSATDESSAAEGRQDGISNEEQEGIWGGKGTAKDAGIPVQRDASLPTDPSCGEEGDPTCKSAIFVPDCLSYDELGKLWLELCGSESSGGRTLEANNPDCPANTDSAWVTCCYAGSTGPFPKDAGVVTEPTQKDAEAPTEPTEKDAAVDECFTTGVGGSSCTVYTELYDKLNDTCEDKGLVLVDFEQHFDAACNVGSGLEATGTCCPR